TLHPSPSPHPAPSALSPLSLQRRSSDLARNEVICTLGDPRVPGLAEEWGTTRTAAAVSLWEPRLEGAVVAIGNAPTALFHLLERSEEHTSELQSRENLVCRLLLEKKKEK